MDALAEILCPDDTDPTATCPPSGSCAMNGESCTTASCCGALSCCGGIPIPPGDEYCSSGPCSISDYNAKQDFGAVDEEALLEGVLALPISRWRYKTDPDGVTHIGPMAQDFKETFRVGGSDRMIFPLDEAGISLVAIQALNRKLETLAAGQRKLERRNERLDLEVTRLQEKVAEAAGPCEKANSAPVTPR